jgi:hypothetical protein
MNNIISTPEEAGSLEPGQWVIDADGTARCLVDTHMGFPQRMWMSKRGRSFAAIDAVTFPVHLADIDWESSDYPDGCPHEWGANECGHCSHCGQVSGQSISMTKPCRYSER